MNERIDFLGLPLNLGVTVADLCDAICGPRQPIGISFINPAAWDLAQKNPDYLTALQKLDFVQPDGESIAFACRTLIKRPCTRISFDMTSLAGPLFDRLSATQKTLFLIGGKPGVDEQMHQKLNEQFPALRIIGSAHGFGDIAAKIALIKSKNPDAVLVGMGAPQQELFIRALHQSGYDGPAITCGGFFDQYIKDAVYYPAWIDKWNLRFAYRLYCEPGRLWRRYLIEYQRFIRLFIAALLTRKERA